MCGIGVIKRCGDASSCLIDDLGHEIAGLARSGHWLSDCGIHLVCGKRSAPFSVCGIPYSFASWTIMEKKQQEMQGVYFSIAFTCGEKKGCVV